MEKSDPYIDSNTGVLKNLLNIVHYFFISKLLSKNTYDKQSF